MNCWGMGMAKGDEGQGLGMTALREEAPQGNQEMGTNQISEMVLPERRGGHH